MKVRHPDDEALDVILATNMISVGVDIDRLGLMAVMGQPQSTSEYIQSTSRVGRRHPGLVVALYNAARSRDRSHYESFRGYHSALYRQVESTSVTPFSARARDRGLHAVLVALARLTAPGFAENERRRERRCAPARPSRSSRSASSSVSQRVGDQDELEATTRAARRDRGPLAAARRGQPEARLQPAVQAGDGAARRCGARPSFEDGQLPDAVVPARRRSRVQSLPRRLMAAIKGQVRRSQLVTTYGVGAVVAVEDESFMVAGIDRWPARRARPARASARTPAAAHGLSPAAGARTRSPTSRSCGIPRWYSCPKCTRLADHRALAGAFDSNKCASATRDAGPLTLRRRLREGPHRRLPVHAVGARGQASRRGRTTSCSSRPRARLPGCETSWSPAAAAGAARWTEPSTANAFQGIASCRGQRPWLQARRRGLRDRHPHAPARRLERVVRSRPVGDQHPAVVRRRVPAPQRVLDDPAARSRTTRSAGRSKPRTSRSDGFSVDDLFAAVQDRKLLEGGEATAAGDARRSSADRSSSALTRASRERRPAAVRRRATARCRTARPWFSQVMMVKRLREVRALRRLHPAPPPRARMRTLAPLVGRAEGLAAGDRGARARASSSCFDETDSRRGRSRPAVVERAGLDQRTVRRHARRAWGRPVDRTITPRLVASHTFAHALINQLSLEAGYPAASLRERLYVFDDAAGLLVYTATTDSAGSLGGVIAQAEPDRLRSRSREAIGRYSWCSVGSRLHRGDGSGRGRAEPRSMPRVRAAAGDELRGDERAARPWAARRHARGRRARSVRRAAATI